MKLFFNIKWAFKNTNWSNSMTLFRKAPPWSCILEILSLLNICNEFPTTFQKTDLRSENFITCSGILEPYYLPCKARLYLDYTDEVRWITILKHILGLHGYIITSLETTRNKKKAIFYTIERANGNLRTAVSVDFS
jgi:hypothetical protein